MKSTCIAVSLVHFTVQLSTADTPQLSRLYISTLTVVELNDSCVPLASDSIETDTCVILKMFQGKVAEKLLNLCLWIALPIHSYAFYDYFGVIANYSRAEGADQKSSCY